MVVAILLATLWPLPEQAYRASLSPVACLVCGDQGVQDVIQNIIMLLPLGLALGLAGVRPGWAALGAFGLAVLVESLQYTVVTGRDASLSDVITNTAGAALGAALAPHSPTLMRPGRRAAARLALAAVLVWAGAWAFGAWALEGNPGAGHWRGRFPGDLPDAPALSGDAVQASIGGTPLGLAPVSLPLEVEQGFARDSFTLRVVVRPGPPIAWRENVVTIIDFRDDGGDANNSLVMMLNRVRHRALLSFRINAARARLRTPSFNLGPAFDVPSGREVTLEVSRARGILRAAAARDGQALATDYRIGPELLWAVMAPRTPQPGLLWRIEAFLWAAVLLAVIAYWAARSRDTGVLVAVSSLAILAQLITPRLFAVAEQSLLGWAILLGGLTLGALVGRRSFPADDSRVTTHDP
ncbi:MAG: VanZ family protein [Gemmatimonadetes bacterium]|nr:VanZ family protein [Gemmatimonadota bacterium]